jgi:hypothetical protein
MTNPVGGTILVSSGLLACSLYYGLTTFSEILIVILFAMGVRQLWKLHRNMGKRNERVSSSHSMSQ